ncbi:MAG: HAMP domain-containing sensor histidine kinase [Verrucomicrobiales bacterium]|nr:HAMP domain-containing sensor histidine kinase [Verrucomicrobiales bacterium]
MKRIALVFLVAILLPALLLAGLAVRSLRDQELVVNSQRIQLHQTSCDAMVTSVNLFMDDVRGFYGEVLDDLVVRSAEGVLTNYDQLLREEWSQAAGGAVVSDAGEIRSPSRDDSEWASRFLDNHGGFLTSQRVVEVYQAPKRIASQLQVIEEEVSAPPVELAKAAESSTRSDDLREEARTRDADVAKDKADLGMAYEPQQRRKVQAYPGKVLSQRFGGEADQSLSQKVEIKEKPSPSMAAPRGKVAGSPAPQAAPAEDLVATSAPMPPAAAPAAAAESFNIQMAEKKQAAQSGGIPQSVRNVAPAQQWEAPSIQQTKTGAAIPEVEGAYNYSSLNRVSASLNEITSDREEGAVSRIIDGELHVLLWKKHPAEPGYTFWAELDLDSIKNDLEDLFVPQQKSVQENEVTLALLDAGGDPVVQSVPGFSTDWSAPFVASEVGQILPRWEVAAYLLNPDALNQSARTVRLTLLLTTLVLVGAVSVGGVLIMRAVNYEMTLATRKTDFVSNVSHELKTPLTSIRMFSELLEKNQNPDAAQTRQYSSVISKESARLTRLINRLLDFSRLDRGEMKLNKEPIDLAQFLKGIVDTYRMQIEAKDLTLSLSIPADPVPAIEGDVDGLSQVFANLLSNAEKYGGAASEIEMELRNSGGGVLLVEVKDRGKAISKANQRRIFEKFYRIDESINSGIEGSGIGLALCRQIVDLHGGQIRYSKRDGGGSVFSVELPIAS